MAGAASSPSLLDVALTLTVKKGPTCSVGDLLERDPIADELRVALASHVTATAIVGALRLRGIELGEHALQRHRRGGCKCP